MTSNKRSSGEDRVSYALRLTLYATCIVVPFIAVFTGALDGGGAVAAAMALLGATGGTVAMTQARKEQTATTSAYREGVGAGLITDIGTPGRHALPDERGEQ